MKLKKLAAATAFVLVLFSPISTVTAKRSDIEPGAKDKNIQLEKREKVNEKERDPIKVLENKKERVKKLLQEGKISKEKADELIKKLDSKIEEIKEFQSLPLEEKRKRIINNFNVELERLVKEGKMDKQEAERLLKEVTEKINRWDGSGYPKHLLKQKGHKHKQ